MVNISRSTSQVCGMISDKADATQEDMSRQDLMTRTGESRCYASGWVQGKRTDTCSRPTYIYKKRESTLYPTH
jgi:hypothetical protein